MMSANFKSNDGMKFASQ